MGVRPRESALLAVCVAAVALLPFAHAAPVCKSATLPGVNLSGGEFNAAAQPGTFARDYIYPGQVEIDLAKRIGAKLIRVPFLWERIQRTALAPLDSGEMARLDAVVGLAASSGLMIILDLHNYGAYRGVSLGKEAGPQSALADVWGRLATRYAANRNVVFGMMNEPNDIGSDAWASIARGALKAIRAAGARNLVLIPGSHWDGVHSWFSPLGGRPNADALLPLSRNDDRVAYEVHQYFDDNFSGASDTCDGAAAVPAALGRIGAWARTHRVRLFLGEFGVSQRPECVKALDEALKVVERDRDVWYGWTYWTAGAWWGDYPFNIQKPGGVTPQGRVLRERANALNSAECAAG